MRGDITYLGKMQIWSRRGLQYVSIHALHSKLSRVRTN
jgi:hypothetical protein